MRKKTIVIRLSDITEVFQRKFNQQYCAFEVFTTYGRCFFFNLFTESDLRSFEIAIQRRDFPGRFVSHLNRAFVNERYLNDWKEGKISNFEYLMALNRFASRSFCDLNQYPVFPWILSDYESDEIVLTEEASFRDLSKPIGALTPEARLEAENTYTQFMPDCEFEPHHFGSHYSTSGSVVYFLLRLEPYTSQAIQLQDGQFDVADRLFASVSGSYYSSTHNSGDNKELIPEAFYLPEMYLNVNRLPLGWGQRGTPVDMVELPAWARSDPHRFVRMHRSALESAKVSERLHQWIDLIFGYQQSGEQARLACNVFLDSAYEKLAQQIIKKAKKDVMFLGYIDRILLYGQMPTQIFQTKHPKKTVEKEPQSTIFSAFTNAEFRPTCSKLLYETEYPLIPVGLFLFRFSMVIVTNDRKVCVYKARPGADRHKEGDYRQLEGVFPDATVGLTKAACGVLLNTYIVTGLHQDKSFKVHSIEKMRLVASVVFHVDRVTCVSTDMEYVLVGSRDTTMSLWKFGGEVGAAATLLKHLRGHTSELSLCSIKWLQQVSISTSTVLFTQNGSVLLHSLRTGLCVRKLVSFPDPPVTMDVSKTGLIAIVVKTDPDKVAIYSINGFLVKCVTEAKEKVTAVLFALTSDSLIIVTDKCVRVVSVFGEFPTKEFPANDGEGTRARIALVVVAQTETGIVRLMMDQEKRETSSKPNLLIDQLNSEGQFTEMISKYGF